MICFFGQAERNLSLPPGIDVGSTMPPLAWAKGGLVELCMLQVELIPNGELEHAVVPVAPP